MSCDGVGGFDAILLEMQSQAHENWVSGGELFFWRFVGRLLQSVQSRSGELNIKASFANQLLSSAEGQPISAHSLSTHGLHIGRWWISGTLAFARDTLLLLLRNLVGRRSALVAPIFEEGFELVTDFCYWRRERHTQKATEPRT